MMFNQQANLHNEEVKRNLFLLPILYYQINQANHLSHECQANFYGAYADWSPNLFRLFQVLGRVRRNRF